MTTPKSEGHPDSSHHPGNPPGPHDPFGLLSAAKLLGHPLSFLENLRNEYGDVVYFALGPLRQYFFFHPDALREILAIKSRSFHKPEQQRMVIGKVLGNGLLLSEDDLWLKQRRLMLPAFNPDRLQRYASTIVTCAQDMLATWSPEKDVDAFSETMELAVRIAGHVFYSIELKDSAKQMAQEALTIFEMMMREFGDFPKFTDHLPIRWKHDYEEIRNNLNNFIERLFTDRKASGEDPGDLLSLLLHAVDHEADGTGMSLEQAHFEAKTMFLAGLDTIAGVLAWTCYLLCKNPEAQSKVHAELDSVLAGRPPGFADAQRLPYTTAAIKESMRIYPPSWMIARQTIEEVEIAGYLLPKGSYVYLPEWAVHRDPRFFHDHEKFLPERFLPGSEEGTNHFSYFPFGGGPRSCIGSHFAMLEQLLVAAVILQRFTVTLAPDHPEVTPDPQMSLLPKGGVRLKLIERVPAMAATGAPA